MATFAASYQQFYHQSPRDVYLKCSTAEVPCPEALGYTQGKSLGSGTYAKVRAAWSPYEHKMIAIKNLNKKIASKDYLFKFLPREISVLQLVTHPNILRIHQIIETQDKCFFMLELAENGDLLDYINSRGFIPENEARFLFKQMTSAILYCHSLAIVHRDLKCENIMLSKDMQVKIGDFGFALQTVNHAHTPCGSYSYAAPELFASTSKSEGYDATKSDIWSLGVILFAIVCGKLPFGDDSQVKRTQKRILSFSRSISDDCKRLLEAMLTTDCSARLNCNDVLDHPWFDGAIKQPNKEHLQAKYTLENCLPTIFHHVRTHEEAGTDDIVTSPYPTLYTRGQSSKCKKRSVSLLGQKRAPKTVTGDTRVSVTAISKSVSSKSDPPSQRSSTKGGRPLVSKIGAAGRRIADAMRYHSKGQIPTSGSGHNNNRDNSTQHTGSK